MPMSVLPVAHPTPPFVLWLLDVFLRHSPVPARELVDYTSSNPSRIRCRENPLAIIPSETSRRCHPHAMNTASMLFPISRGREVLAFLEQTKSLCPTIRQLGYCLSSAVIFVRSTTST
ncbi:hypothetical protein BJ912DRAFT_25714 [Pholiota molesta]|nr:hypothetical protein BJ912DRAFT_25714 [Pholiota molesta]